MNKAEMMTWCIVIVLTFLAIIKIYFQVRIIKKQQKKSREKY